MLESKALNHEHIYLRQENRISFRQRYLDEMSKNLCYKKRYDG